MQFLWLLWSVFYHTEVSKIGTTQNLSEQACLLLSCFIATSAITLYPWVLLMHWLSFPLQQLSHRRYSRKHIASALCLFLPYLSFFNGIILVSFCCNDFLSVKKKMKIKDPAEWIVQLSLLVSPTTDCAEPPSLQQQCLKQPITACLSCSLHSVLVAYSLVILTIFFPPFYIS